MSESVFDQRSIREHASQVTASVRAINHLSLPWAAGASLPHPSDVAVVVGELALAVRGLRQATAQLADHIDRLEQAGRLRDMDPHPIQPGRAARACVLLTVSVAAATGRLATALDTAEQHLSCLTYNEPTRPATPGTTPPDTARPGTATPAVGPTELPGLGR